MTIAEIRRDPCVLAAPDCLPADAELRKASALLFLPSHHLLVVASSQPFFTVFSHLVSSYNRQHRLLPLFRGWTIYIMATQTQVLIAHTGQRLQVDTSQFSSYVYLRLSTRCPMRPAESACLTNLLRVVSMISRDGSPGRALYPYRI